MHILPGMRARPLVLVLVLALGLPASPLAAQPDAGGPAAQPVIDAARVQAIQHQLQGQLDRLGGVASITRCGPVLELVTPQTGGFDRSFGAVCELQVADHRVQATMCDDTRGQRFTLSLAVLREVDAIRRFIIGDCLPSG